MIPGVDSGTTAPGVGGDVLQQQFIIPKKRPPGSSKMGRPKGSMNAVTDEQIRLFKKYAKKYGCPLEALFKIGFDSGVRMDMRIGALRVALSRGMPELRSVEIKGQMELNNAATINLTVGGQQQMGAQAPQPLRQLNAVVEGIATREAYDDHEDQE